ncbi:MAG: hypothetical protein ABFR53_12290 [Actinomycetota bacterium]
MRAAATFPGAGKGVESAQKGMKLPVEILTPKDVLAILDQCKDTVTGIRDRALITVMYRSGPASARGTRPATEGCGPTYLAGGHVIRGRR